MNFHINETYHILFSDLTILLNIILLNIFRYIFVGTKPLLTPCYTVFHCMITPELYQP